MLSASALRNLSKGSSHAKQWNASERVALPLHFATRPRASAG